MTESAPLTGTMQPRRYWVPDDGSAPAVADNSSSGTRTYGASGYGNASSTSSLFNGSASGFSGGGIGGR